MRIMTAKELHIATSAGVLRMLKSMTEDAHWDAVNRYQAELVRYSVTSDGALVVRTTPDQRYAAKL